MKKLATLLLAFAMILSLAACGGKETAKAGTNTPATEQSGEKTPETARITIAAGTSGSAFFSFGAAMANEVNNNSEWLEASVVTTSGTTENYALVQSGEADMAFCTYDNMLLAYEGKGDFEKNGAYDNLRILLLGHSATSAPVVFADSKYKTIADCTDARIAVSPGSGPLANAQAIFAPWGIELTDENMVILAYGEMAEGLKDGTIDVACYHVPHPNAQLMDAESAGDIRILSQTEESQAKLLEMYPDYVAATIPAGTYGSFQEDALSHGNFACMIVNKDVSDEVVKEYLEIVMNTDLSNVYPYGNDWSYGNTRYGTELLVPYHPGSEVWLTENGYLK